MSASAAAHEGSRSTNAFTATRSCTITCRLIRSTSGPATVSSRRRVQPPGGAGDVHHQVGAALEFVGDAERDPGEAQVGRGQTREADDPQALVLDRVAQRVDGVVVGDDPIGVVEVAGEERLGARTDGVEGQRREAHDVEAHVVDARPDLGVRLLGHDLRGDHDLIMVWPVEAVGSLHRLFPLCSPSIHHVATARPRCLRTLRAERHCNTKTSVHVPGGTPTCSVRSLVAAASCSPRWRCRCCSSATPRPPPRRPRPSSRRRPSTVTAPPSSWASTRSSSAASSSSRRR